MDNRARWERERHPLFDSFRDGTQCSTLKLPWIFFVTTDNIFCHLPKHDLRALLQELLSVQSPWVTQKDIEISTIMDILFYFFFCLFPCRSHLKSVLRPATVAAVTNQGHIGEDTFTVLHSDLQPCLSCRFVSAICITKRCPSCFT